MYVTQPVKIVRHEAVPYQVVQLPGGIPQSAVSRKARLTTKAIPPKFGVE